MSLICFSLINPETEFSVVFTTPEIAAEKLCPYTNPPANTITPTIPISVVVSLVKSLFLRLTITLLPLIGDNTLDPTAVQMRTERMIIDHFSVLIAAGRRYFSG